MLKFFRSGKGLLVVCAILINARLQSQVNIVSANFTSFNVSPGSLVDLQVMNPGASELQVVVESKLFNSNNEILLQVKTNPVILKMGLNPIRSSNPSYSYVNYTSNNYSQYIQSTKTLPSGKYRFCTTVTAVNTSEPQSDDYCDELEAEGNNLLYLISVPDKEEIETDYPVLVWYHSEPFNLLAANEFYRLVLVELTKDQSADAAVTVNQPLYVKNFLTTHSIQYPIDAKKLEQSKHYAWQVQKMSNGAVIDKTEAWEFTIAEKKKITDVKYAVLKQNPESGYYQVTGDKIFFKYDEKYSGEGLICKIKSDKNKYIEVKPKNEEVKQTSVSGNVVRNVGPNYYEYNLEEYNLSDGFYWLEVVNEKGNTYRLKFLVGSL